MKIIKLTESDLQKIVKRVINEQVLSDYQKIQKRLDSLTADKSSTGNITKYKFKNADGLGVVELQNNEVNVYRLKGGIRELLGKIRKLQNENHQIGLTSSKDVKKLLNENRNFLLKEENSDIQNVTPDEQREEESNFKGTVSKLVKFTPIKVYKQNV